jgi:phage gp29-like protein
MKRFFQRSSKSVRPEAAPQYAAFQREALRVPGVPPGPLPYATYAEMERDPMVQTALTIKRLAVLAAPWRVVPADSSSAARERADFVLAQFETMEGSVGSILESTMDAFRTGWSVQEMVMAPSEGRIALEAVRSKDPSLFGLQMDRFGRLTGLRLQVPGDAAVDLPRAKFVVYANRSRFGRPKGLSDLDAAYPHFVAKRSLLGAWRVHLERFASPTVLAKYARGLSSDEQTRIFEALRDIEKHTTVVFPNEIDVSTLGGHREQVSGFLDALEFHNREIARSILGQTLTTDEGRRVGSLALGKVHLQVLLLQVAAVRAELADRVMTEQVIRPLVELNFGPGQIPRFEFEPTPLEAFVRGSVG